VFNRFEKLNVYLGFIKRRLLEISPHESKDLYISALFFIVYKFLCSKHANFI